MAKLGEEDPIGGTCTSKHWMLSWDTDQQPSLLYSSLLDTAAEQLVASSAVDDEREEDELEEPFADEGSASTSTTGSDSKQSESSKSKTSTGIKGGAQKRIREEKMDSVMKKVVKDVVDAQQKSAEMF